MYTENPMEIQIDTKVDHIQFRQEIPFHAYNRSQHIFAVAKRVIFGSAQLNCDLNSNQHSMDGDV